MNTIKKYAKIVIPILVIVFVVYRASIELKSISIKEALHTLSNVSTFDTAFIIGFGLLAVLSMTLYDAGLVKGMGIDIPTGKYVRTGFISSALNSVIGFGGLAGASLRHVTYRSYYKDHKSLLQGITWMTTGSLNGLSFLAILVLVHIFPADRLLADKPWIWPVIIGMAFFMPGYFIITYLQAKKEKGHSSSFKPFFKMNGMFSAASIIEWLFAAAVLLLLLYLFGIDFEWRTAMGIFVLSAIVGTISFVPGGFGSFDLTFLLGMSFYGLPEEQTLTVLLMYRIVYYIIPFLLALLLTVLDLTGATIKKVEDKPFIGPAIETSGVVWSIYRDFLSKIGYWALSLLVLYAAWLNITSVLIVPMNERLFSIRLFDLCYNIILACSIILVLNLKGIFNRTKKSFVFVSISLCLSIFAHLLKSFDFHEAVLIGIVLAVLIIVRKQFIVENMIVSFFYYIWTVILTVAMLAIYFYLGVALSALGEPEHFRTFSEVLESTIFAAVCVPGAMLLGSYFFNRIRKREIGIEFNRSLFKDFLSKHNGNSLTHLAFMGDKRLFFSSDGKALILFRKYKNRLIVLGDPNGDQGSFSLALNEFMKEANRLGYLVVFYQVDQSFMHLYHDFGYQFFKLGEEAYVDLDEFTLSGKKKAGLRATFNRFEREEYQFEVLPTISDTVYKELRLVSNQWLGKRKEKGFSIGEFEEDYIREAPVAILKDKSNKIIAFATIMPMYEEQKCSIDLMRHVPDAPVGTMDAIFIHLFQYAKENGYRYFNLGMAPLSNVGTKNEAFFAERIAANVYNNIQYMYSFSGLRKFKEKYHPKWSGKYMAYRKNKTLVASMVLVTRMIGKGNTPLRRKRKKHEAAFENKSYTG
ncbi:bifunctional lysylphosphatidylglycerol flippase/synthetase MprF [Bacillus sp. 1P06AnD]|uniref:bifunctional lysylphosphatidylglycerol flippase/synthetase MprF n=1 Tax=Bacillus sp. 1P06AnD TaxID=3132208 RepID=UPI0039A11AFD